MHKEEKCYLYWIHRECHRSIKKQGYIGITNDPNIRFSRHMSNAKIGKETGCTHLYHALNKYDDIMFDIICIGTREYVLALEKKFRSRKKIGWNIAEGGYYPPTEPILIEYDGVVRTVKDWADIVGVDTTTIYNRLKKGYSTDEALKPTRKPKTATMNGVTKTIREWAEEYDTTFSLINDRLSWGWDLKDALTTPVRGTQTFEYMGEYKTPEEWYKYLDFKVDKETVRRNLKNGSLSIEELLQKDPYQQKLYTYKNETKSLPEFGRQYNKTYATLRFRLKEKNMTIAEAIETPDKESEIYEYRGKMYTVSELLKLSGLKPVTIRSRIKRSRLSMEKVVETPLHQKNQYIYKGKSKTAREWFNELNPEIMWNTFRNNLTQGKTVEECLRIKPRKLNKNKER